MAGFTAAPEAGDALRGNLLPPVANRPLNAGFGLRPRFSSPTEARHTGLSFSVKGDEPVVACARGVVAQSVIVPGLGRLLIALLLHPGGLLSEPLLYLSLYLKEHRAAYYELLDRVRATGDWEAWQNFSVPIAPTAGVQNIALVFLPPGYAAGNTTIFAQVPAGVDPNAAGEVHVRQTVFYPAAPYVDNITVRGFTLERAATQWAPPSSEQVGIIGTHWSKGWLSEDNEVRYSRCSCVALGKYGDGFDNTNDQGQADPYTACVYRALANGWHKDRVGSHTVRNNVRYTHTHTHLRAPIFLPASALPIPTAPPPPPPTHFCSTSTIAARRAWWAPWAAPLAQ
jgi:hypothetical protein